jgi:hypothetical protein
VVAGGRCKSKHIGWIMIAMVGALLQACAPKPPPAPPARVFATDLEGAAKICEVPKIAPVAAEKAQVTIQVGNDGGWCGVAVAAGGKPYAAGLLTAPPAHGRVLIHTVGDVTRVDYTPESQFFGPDGFTIQLLPGDAVLRVEVSVSRSP